MEHESDDSTNCSRGSSNSKQKMGPRAGGLGNNGQDRDCRNYSIIEIEQNTEKNAGDLSRFTAPVKDHHLTLMSKIIIAMEHECDGDTNNNWNSCNYP